MPAGPFWRAFAKTISSEPFARGVLVENHYGEGHEQPNQAEQRNRHKRINVGDRCRRSAWEKPCNCSGHVTLQNLGGGSRLILSRAECS
jgi:hypothetical protein